MPPKTCSRQSLCLLAGFAVLFLSLTLAHSPLGALLPRRPGTHAYIPLQLVTPHRVWMGQTITRARPLHTGYTRLSKGTPRNFAAAAGHPVPSSDEAYDNGKPTVASTSTAQAYGAGSFKWMGLMGLAAVASGVMWQRLHGHTAAVHASSVHTAPQRRYMAMAAVTGEATPLTHLNAAQAQAIDDELMGERGFSIDCLMELAGLSVACAVQKEYAPCKILIVCGPGNNGGDGLVAARHLAHFGFEVLPEP